FVGLIRFGGIGNVKAGFTQHDPIRINNNTELAALAGLEGWAGDGSPGNPYIIEGYDINGSGYGYCIYIGNTTDSFVVRDSFIHEAIGAGNPPYYSDSGITLYNVQNGSIVNNTVTMNNYYGIYGDVSTSNIIANNNVSNNNFLGIYLLYSDSNIVANNTISKSSDGISLRYSNLNNVINNTIFSNNFRAIRIYCSNENSFSKNVMNGCGIYIWGGSLANWNTHNIDTSNTVDGKPVYYWKNQTSGKIPSGAGEVILANCINVIVENQNLRNGTVGIELGFSNDNIIANNTAFSNKQDGIYLKNSLGNIIINNTLLNNEGGIYLSDSSSNTITNNNVSSNNGVGISLWYADSNTIINNTAWNNYQGVLLRFSNSNTITNNTSTVNLDDGIHLISSGSNTFTKNTISSNNQYGIYFDLASGNTMYHNNFISNAAQAYESHTNQWDDGYPSGGNYWSDFDEPLEGAYDNNTGPNQDVPGKDGIVDTPYNGIGGTTGSLDKYPLMAPYKPLENYTILKQGWNLVSIPLIQEEQNMTRVLGSIQGLYDAVQWFNTSDSNDPWKHYKVGKSFGNDLSELNESKGFWIHISQPGDTIFVYNGTQPTVNQNISLIPGWNLVGYPSINAKNRTDALNNIDFGSDVDAIWTYNATTQTWKEITASDNFEVGRGYWMHSKVTKTWIVLI
ncbi:MAG: NosD domain-containing protein, partial [Candidatus Kariarchaeaceae archaeon]